VSLARWRAPFAAPCRLILFVAAEKERAGAFLLSRAIISKRSRDHPEAIARSPPK
jgi:hypothetical protein